MSYIRVDEVMFWASDIRVILGPIRDSDPGHVGRMIKNLLPGQNFVWLVAIVLSDLPGQGRVEFRRPTYDMAANLLKQIVDKTIEWRDSVSGVNSVSPLVISTGG